MFAPVAAHPLSQPQIDPFGDHHPWYSEPNKEVVNVDTGSRNQGGRRRCGPR